MIKNLLDQNEVATHCDACHDALDIQFAELRVRVRSNQTQIISALQDYYKSYLGLSVEASNASIVQVFVIEHSVLGEDLDWLEVPREAGKQGRKEGYLDVAGGRWIKKFKTGMSFFTASRKCGGDWALP